MCNRFIVAGERARDLLDALLVRESIESDLDIRPSDPVPVIARKRNRTGNELLMTNWGFIPANAREEGSPRLLINARAEGISEKPTFSEAFRNRRCIVPASAFFEFDDDYRYRASLKSGATMALAGLFQERFFKGRSLVTSTVITVEPNPLIAGIHDRMPAILRPEDWERWLDPTFIDARELGNMLTPFPEAEMNLTKDAPRAVRKSKAPTLDL